MVQQIRACANKPWDQSWVSRAHVVVGELISKSFSILLAMVCVYSKCSRLPAMY